MDDTLYFHPDFPYLLSIGLQNFQTIREYVEIPIAPITLIYGPNSAGKSAIADALILGASFADNYSFDAIDGFEKWNRRWASRKRFDSPLTDRFVGRPSDLVLSYEYKLVSSVLAEWIKSIGGDHIRINFDRPDLYASRDDFKHVLESFLSIEYPEEGSAEAWDYYLELKDSITVRLCFDKSAFASDICISTLKIPIFHWTPGWKGSFRINTAHPRFYVFDYHWEGGLFAILDKYFSPRESKGVRMDGDWIVVDNVDLSDYQEDPNFDSDIASSLPRHLFVFIKFFSRGVLIGLRSACELLRVGPVRAIPTISGSVFPVRSYHEWHRRVEQSSIFEPWEYLAAAATGKDHPSWRGLDFRAENLFSYVNRVLRDPIFIDSEYQLVAQRHYRATERQLRSFIEESEDRRAKAMNNLLSEVRLFLKSDVVEGDIELEDVGAGISQMIPVLAACGTSTQIHVQQPELHLHPRLQAQLADIFIERMNTAFDRRPPESFFEDSSSDRSGMLSAFTIDAVRADAEFKKERNKHKPPYRTMAILETHSEYLILRMLKRIRETSSAQIKNRRLSLYPEQMSVLYFDKQADGSSIVRRLRIAPDGEFIDRWPKGFFIEREAELFDE